MAIIAALAGLQHHVGNTEARRLNSMYILCMPFDGSVDVNA
jgi:hypothetical protein